MKAAPELKEKLLQQKTSTLQCLVHDCTHALPLRRLAASSFPAIRELAAISLRAAALDGECCSCLEPMYPGGGRGELAHAMGMRCGHTVCKGCMTNIVLHNTKATERDGEARVNKCPKCRSPFGWGVEDAPRICAVESLAAILFNASKE